MDEIFDLLNERYKGFVFYNKETNEITVKVFISYPFLWKILNEKCIIHKYTLYPADSRIVIEVIKRRGYE